MSKIERAEELEEVYMKNRWNSVVIAQLKVIDWEWRRRAHLMTLIKSQMDEMDNQKANTVDDLFTLADSVKEEIPKVNLVARPYTPTTAKQVARSRKDIMEAVREKQKRNLREEAAIQTGSLYVELAERKAAKEKKGPRKLEPEKPQTFVVNTQRHSGSKVRGKNLCQSLQSFICTAREKKRKYQIDTNPDPGKTISSKPVL